MDRVYIEFLTKVLKARIILGTICTQPALLSFL